MEQINIIQLCETLGKGGLENVIRDIVLSSDPDRFQHHVICTHEGGMTAEDLKARGVPVYILKGGRNRLMQIRSLVVRIARKRKSTLVHCHGLFAVGTEAILCRLLGVVGIVVHVHNLVPRLSPGQRVKRTVLNRLVDDYIAVSKKVEHSLRAKRFDRITTIQNGTDLAKWEFHAKPASGSLGFPEDAFVLGMIGRVVKRKGFDLFLEVLAANREVYGIIVGEGDYYDPVVKKLQQMGLEKKVRCFPFDPNLQKYYAMLDALFLYSTHEGLPLVLLESQASGVPYLGNPVGGVGEVVRDGENGYLIESENPDVIRDRIERIRKNARSLRSRCRKKIEDHFSLKEQVKSIEEIYLKNVTALPNCTGMKKRVDHG